VTGYYGVGTSGAIGKTNEALLALKTLYQESLFFKTLIDNCEMAMKKCYFHSRNVCSTHIKMQQLWQMIYDEFELSKKYIFCLTATRP
jgi:phosphoenolpyruvate carboxylase